MKKSKNCTPYRTQGLRTNAVYSVFVRAVLKRVAGCRRGKMHQGKRTEQGHNLLPIRRG